ncbi:MAG TPA: penicillin-binding transpeptidase domain-containing protein, partial [Planctomycetota bacterium]|nr:penicillin-binding transpeptidase domain-containing protein [Planctomycetota bacterium]
MFQRRLVILLVLIAAMMLLVVGRLFHLQILQGERYLDLARRKIAYQDDIETTRGLIVDRVGRELAVNENQYDVCIYLRNFDRLDDPQGWCDGFATLIGRPPSDVTDAITALEEHLRTLVGDALPEIQRSAELAYHRRRPQVILSGLTREQIIALRLGEANLPQYVRRGVTHPVFVVRDALVRRYPYGQLASHLIGRLGRINPEEYNEKGYRFTFDGSELKRFRESDLIGRTGLEARHERLLRGARGRLRGIRNVRHEVVPGMPTTRIEPVPGWDLELTLDAMLQGLAEKALDDAIAEISLPARRPGDLPVCGALVLINPHNGDVLAAASTPRYDLNNVLRDWRVLAAETNESRPLIHRAFMGGYPLGSVFKVVVAVAGLEENLLSGHTEFDCDGAFLHGDQILRCTGTHGRVEMSQAIERSCNVYFWNAGLLVGPKLIKEWAERMGLGVSAGIDLSERRGSVPLARSSGETLNLAVGQGRLVCTPLQVARMMGCIALSGKLPDSRLCATARREIAPDALRPGMLVTLRTRDRRRLSGSVTRVSNDSVTLDLVDDLSDAASVPRRSCDIA